MLLGSRSGTASTGRSVSQAGRRGTISPAGQHSAQRSDRMSAALNTAATTTAETVEEEAAAVGAERGAKVPHLARLRRRQALSQRELAEQAKVNRTTISNAEMGEFIAFRSGRRLAAALGVGPTDLMVEEGTPAEGPPTTAPDPPEHMAHRTHDN